MALAPRRQSIFFLLGFNVGGLGLGGVGGGRLRRPGRRAASHWQYCCAAGRAQGGGLQRMCSAVVDFISKMGFTYGIATYIHYIQLHTDYICYTGIREQKHKVTFGLHINYIWYIQIKIPNMMLIYVTYNYIQSKSHTYNIRISYELHTHYI